MQPVFWRDAALPFIEARAIRGGRDLCYARHTHDTFSIGAVTGGVSTYWNRRSKETIVAGSVVVINPEDAHACNPAAAQPWSYRMFYVDVDWLAGCSTNSVSAATRTSGPSPARPTPRCLPA